MHPLTSHWTNREHICEGTSLTSGKLGILVIDSKYLKIRRLLVTTVTLAVGAGTGNTEIAVAAPAPWRMVPTVQYC